MIVPPTITERIRVVFGSTGDLWLNTISETVASLCDRWSIELDGDCWGNYSVVLPGRSTGIPVVLKLVPPSHVYKRELNALSSWNGNGAVQVIDADSSLGAMLLQRAIPGTQLTNLHRQGLDEAATKVACELMISMRKFMPPDTSIWQSAEDRGKELSGIRERFDGGTGPLPEDLVSDAESLFSELVSSQSDQVLIHGDLHHENILLNGDNEWLAIDPHGLIAEPAFETYSLLLNPTGIAKHPDVIAITKRRVDQIADITGFHRERVQGWGIACGALSAWWTVQADCTDYDDAISIAQILRSF